MKLTGMHFAVLVFISSLISVPLRAYGAPPAQGQTLSITTEEMPPFNMSVNGKIAGIATDHLTQALERSGIDYKISSYPWLRAYDMALKGANTCVYSTNRTQEREPLFKWVGPLAEDSWVIFARAQSRIKVASLEDLRGYRIGAGKGDALAIFLREQGFDIDDVVHPTVPANELNLKKLQSGRIDFWAAGRITGVYTAAQFGAADIKIILTLRRTALYMACSKSVSDGLIDRLNAELEVISKNWDVSFATSINQ